MYVLCVSIPDHLYSLRSANAAYSDIMYCVGPFINTPSFFIYKLDIELILLSLRAEMAALGELRDTPRYFFLLF